LEISVAPKYGGLEEPTALFTYGTFFTLIEEDVFPV
jgi:hypothetical protein